MPAWWPFGHKADPAGGDAAQGPVPAPTVRTDWSHLPPIQRAISEHPLTAPAGVFNAGLVTHQDPTVLARSLGHEISQDAPRGLVLGTIPTARPITHADGPEMVQRPRLQRRPLATGEPTAEVSEEGFTSPLPVRQLPVIDVAAAAATPLTRLAPDSEPLALQPRSRPGPPPVAARPPVQASPERTPSAEPTTTDSSQSRLTLGQSRRLGLGAPLTEIPDRAQRSPAEATVLPLKPSTASRAPQAAEPAMAPLPASSDVTPPIDLASAANVQRSGNASAPAPQPLTLAPQASSDMIRRSSEDVDATFKAQPAATPQLAPLVGTAPVALVAGPVNVQRSAETSPAPTEVLDLAPSLPRGAPDHDSRQTIGPVGLISSGEPDFGLPSAPGLASTIRPQSTASTAPLLSERPLRPASVQRSVEPVPSQVQETMRQALGADLTNTRVHRGGEASEAATALQARAFTQGDDVYLPASHGPLNSGPARSLLAHELTHVAQQRRLGSALPPEASTGGQHLEAEARGMESTSFSEMPLAPRVQSAPAAGATQGREATSMEATASQLIGAGMATRAGDGSLIFRAPEGAPAAAPWASSSAPAVQREAAAAAAPAAPRAATATSDADLEELARKLYEPIRSRLRTELLIDRERAGMIADIR